MLAGTFCDAHEARIACGVCQHLGIPRFSSHNMGADDSKIDSVIDCTILQTSTKAGGDASDSSSDVSRHSAIALVAEPFGQSSWMVASAHIVTGAMV